MLFCRDVLDRLEFSAKPQHTRAFSTGQLGEGGWKREEEGEGRGGEKEGEREGRGEGERRRGRGEERRGGREGKMSRGCKLELARGRVGVVYAHTRSSQVRSS